MNARVSAAHQLGFWSALSVAVLGAVYVATGVAWVVADGAQAAKSLQPTEPFLSLLELLIVLSAPALVALSAAVYASAPPDRQPGALTALALMTAFAALTAGVHFARLAVVGRLPADTAPELALLRLYPWPSVALALDFLAWDFFLGLALVLTAPAFAGGRLWLAARVATTVTGMLCLAGTLGPLLGDLRLQFLAIAGYAGGLPVTCALLAVRFGRAGVSPPNVTGGGPGG